MKNSFIKILFVGTASGKTSLKRNHSSILINANSHNLLIDAGDGTAKALLTQKIYFNEIHSILFTHYHADHFSGIASLITQMKLSGRNIPLTIYTHNNLMSALTALLNSVYMFKENLCFKLNIKGIQFGKRIRVCDSFYFTIKQNSHIINKNNFKNIPDELFISSSVMLNIFDRNIFYTSDVGSKNDLYLFQPKKIECLISEAYHISFNEIIEYVNNTNPKKTFITHYNDNDESALKKSIKKFQKYSPKKIILAHDGLIEHL